MPTSTNVTNLKINELKESQYDTAVQQGVIGANELSILTDANAGQVIQVATLPTASADELENIYQFVGTTDANYTNGYFYKCVSDGQQPATYSWSRVDVQPSSSYTAGTGISISNNTISVDSSVAINNTSSQFDLAICDSASASGQSVAIGYQSNSTNLGVAVGKSSAANNGVGIGFSCQGTASNTIAIGRSQVASAQGAIQIGTSSLGYSTNSDANTFKVANANGNFEIMSADGTIPSDRLIHAINKYSTMPTAASTNLGWIVQFTGTTDSTYTHGHLYECVSDGQNPATYSWTEVSMGGGSSYTAGTGIDITSGVISVTYPTLKNNGGTDRLGIGNQTNASGSYSTAVGYNCGTGSSGIFSLALGYAAHANASYCIQLNCGSNVVTNSDSNTVKIANANGNYEMMSADGTIPTARLTKVNSTITLTAAGWSSNTQTVNVTGMTATGVVFPSPVPADQSAYTSAGILCTAQAAGTLTFTCDTVPSGDIDVNIVCL